MENATATVTTCPKCSAELAAGERFCGACGAAVGDPAAPPLFPYVETERDGGSAARASGCWRCPS